MLHFLPQQNRKKVISEYILRVCTCFLLFVSIAAAFFIILFLPSVFFSLYKYKNVEYQLSSANISVTNKSIDPIAMIKRVNTLPQIFSDASTTGIMVTDVLQKIISLKNSHIQIKHFAITGDAFSQRIIMQGTSATRDGLIAFQDSLKAESTFTSVDLPVSFLIKDTDNDFTMTVVYTHQ